MSRMSRDRSRWDHAVAERVFGTSKGELNREMAIGTRGETRAVVFVWIDVRNNRERRRSRLGIVAPVVFEEKHQLLS